MIQSELNDVKDIRFTSLTNYNQDKDMTENNNRKEFNERRTNDLNKM